MSRIVWHIEDLTENACKIADLCRENGISLALVSKFCLSYQPLVLPLLKTAKITTVCDSNCSNFGLFPASNSIENEKNISINEECSGLEFTYQVREKLNRNNFYWIIGADNVINLDKWKEFDTLKKDNFIVINRSNIDISFYMKKHGIKNYTVINDIDIEKLRNNIPFNIYNHRVIPINQFL